MFYNIYWILLKFNWCAFQNNVSYTRITLRRPCCMHILHKPFITFIWVISLPIQFVYHMVSQQGYDTSIALSNFILLRSMIPAFENVSAPHFCGQLFTVSVRIVDYMSLLCIFWQLIIWRLSNVFRNELPGISDQFMLVHINCFLAL